MVNRCLQVPIYRTSLELENTLNYTVTQRCEEDTNAFLWEINQERPKEYAVLMYDSFGKMGSNVRGGNANRPGLLQECRSAHGPTFSGQYCQLFLRQDTVEYFVGICVPDSCAGDDVEMLVVSGRLQFGQMSLIPPFPSILVNQSNQQLIMTRCLPTRITPDASHITCLFVCCVMVAIPLAATLFTTIIVWQRSREISPSGESSSLNTGLNLYGTLKSNDSSGSEMNGNISEENNNTNTMRKITESSVLYVFTISGPVYLAVDTFLLLGGLLSARSLLNSINRAEGKLSASLVANYLFNRIKRLQPLHLFIMCFTHGLICVVQWGPYWFPYLDIWMNCKPYWWAHVLLINNLINDPEVCIPWSWYLSLDFQCYATTPLLLYFYKLNKGVFAAVAGGLLLMTTAASAITTALLQLPVFGFSALKSYNYIFRYYTYPHTRYGPFLIGILTGMYLTSKKEQLLKQKWQAALGWFCSLSLMAVVVGLAYVLKETPDHPSVPHALYQGLHRELWSLAVTWIIVACEDGHGGFIKSFLSLGFWLPLSNISFASYLSHPVLILLYMGLQETPTHYTALNFMYLFLGHLVLTLVGSYVLTVLIEKPYLLKYSRT
ncbi:hypothetical protein F2P81_016134 [Scophthalmus maximus]|uniref:Nose resistant-to-fluoxetine protein N-terminal domain-containing protein n=1 Tax=Scophthalmus maximus TaxID=52904 RepID=A0A6A4SGF5_SCOMX|nr:hypothetical protein F2P81_016134 [Scophthalmus maximus]